MGRRPRKPRTPFLGASLIKAHAGTVGRYRKRRTPVNCRAAPCFASLVNHLQHAAAPGCLLLCGKSGSGKTTFALRYLVARRDLTCRFIFEGPKLDISARLGLRLATSEDELTLAMEDGFVLYDCSAMFPGDRRAGLEWFARWSYDAAAQMPGRKVLMVDEVWKYCSPHAIPQALAEWILDGRKLGMETLFASQQPNRINEAITNEVTELIAFRLQGENALAKISGLGLDSAEIASLPLGSFVALNCETGGELRGRLW